MKSLVLAVFLVALPAAAAAQALDDAGVPAVDAGVALHNPALTEGATSLVEIAFYGVGVVALTLGAMLINTIRRRFNLDITPASEKKLYELIDRGIHYAEEVAHKRVKAGMKGMPQTPKLELAAEFVMDFAKDRKLKELGKDKLQKLIESRLGENRVYAAPGVIWPKLLDVTNAKPGTSES